MADILLSEELPRSPFSGRALRSPSEGPEGRDEDIVNTAAHSDAVASTHTQTHTQTKHPHEDHLHFGSSKQRTAGPYQNCISSSGCSDNTFTRKAAKNQNKPIMPLDLVRFTGANHPSTLVYECMPFYLTPTF